MENKSRAIYSRGGLKDAEIFLAPILRQHPTEVRQLRKFSIEDGDGNFVVKSSRGRSYGVYTEIGLAIKGLAETVQGCVEHLSRATGLPVRRQFYSYGEEELEAIWGVSH